MSAILAVICAIQMQIVPTQKVRTGAHATMAIMGTASIVQVRAYFMHINDL